MKIYNEIVRTGCLKDEALLNDPTCGEGDIAYYTAENIKEPDKVQMDPDIPEQGLLVKELNHEFYD